MQDVTLSNRVIYNGTTYEKDVVYNVPTAVRTELLRIEAEHVASYLPIPATPPPASLFDIPYDAVIKAWVDATYAKKASPTFTGTLSAAAINASGAVTAAGVLSANGGLKLSVATTLAANTTLTAASLYTQRVDATAAARTITLPTAVGNSGLTFLLKKIDASANAVTIACNGAQTIEGTATKSLATQWTAIKVQSDGANWILV